MKVDIRDVEAVRAVRPVDAAFYLRATGWLANEATANGGSLWVRTVHDQEFEALLPMDHELRDYALRMGDLLAVLAAAEGRSQSEVYGDLLTITSDVTRIRISDPDLTDGTLAIEEHAQIAQKARDLVLAAACAATERRAVWHMRKPSRATEHVRRVRIGQSERGSHVVTVVSRITPQLHTPEEARFEAEPPYERKVTQTLAESLLALDEAAGRAALTQQVASFDEAVSRGVNANLCDAVVGLWGDDARRTLEFSFSWSPARPAKPDAIRRVSISSDRLPVIREAARLMREKAPLVDIELVGPVVKLDRPDGAATGRVTVARYADEGPRRVTLELGDPLYQMAVAAHHQRHTLHAGGTLVKDGRGFVLKEPRGVYVEAEEG